MQRRIVALVAAAVAVLGALVVLVMRVRAPSETVVPDEALAQARASFERSRSAAPPPPTIDRAEPVEPPPIPMPPEQEPVASRGSWGSARGLGARRGARVGGAPVEAAAEAEAAPATAQLRLDLGEAYDQGDYETAFTKAEEFLAVEPTNEYVQRVAAVSACAIGNEPAARKHHGTMTGSNQRIVARRCARYGVTL